MRFVYIFLHERLIYVFCILYFIRKERFFAKRFKILLDTDLKIKFCTVKIILLETQTD